MFVVYPDAYTDWQADFGHSNEDALMNNLHSPTGEEKPLASLHAPGTDRDRRAIQQPLEQRPKWRKNPWQWMMILAVVLVILGSLLVLCYSCSQGH